MARNIFKVDDGRMQLELVRTIAAIAGDLLVADRHRMDREQLNTRKPLHPTVAQSYVDDAAALFAAALPLVELRTK